MYRLIYPGRAFARSAVAGLLFLTALIGLGGEFSVRRDVPTLDRWMYPFGFERGSEVSAATFGSFDPRFDTRDAQFLLGWDLADAVPTQRPAARYLVKRVRVIASCATENFPYDPSHDDYRTYLTNSPLYVVDGDLGRPAELVGVGFRGDFTAATFKENSFFGPLGPISGSNISIGTRNAFGAVFDTNGVLADISNQVGQTNATLNYPPYEFSPWATGVAPALQSGDPVVLGTAFQFDLDLTDPLVVGYLQVALREGRLRLMITSLHPAVQSGFGGGGAYPRWYTKENLLGTPARLELDVTVVDDTDTDKDGLPDDWERFYFDGLVRDGTLDADQDGMSDAWEYRAGTNPKLASSVLRVVAYRREDGAAVLRFPVAAGQRVVIERSSDLKDWSEVPGRLTYPETGIAEWLEQDPTVPPGEPPHRFHRVRVEL
jgi:hypothetical protein